MPPCCSLFRKANGVGKGREIHREKNNERLENLPALYVPSPGLRTSSPCAIQPKCNTSMFLVHKGVTRRSFRHNIAFLGVGSRSQAGTVSSDLTRIAHTVPGGYNVAACSAAIIVGCMTRQGRIVVGDNKGGGLREKAKQSGTITCTM